MAAEHAAHLGGRLSAADWDRRAPNWHQYDTAGITGTVISASLAQLRAPVLYVGGGRGNYAIRLVRWFGADRVIVLDWSPAMARRAAADFGLTTVVGDAGRLPLRSRSVQSVFCTTGILEHVDADAQIGILAELLRACGPDGVVLLTVFDVEVPAASLARVAAGCAASISVVRRWPAAGIALYRLTRTEDGSARPQHAAIAAKPIHIKDNWNPLIRSKASGPMRRRWRDAVPIDKFRGPRAPLRYIVRSPGESFQYPGD